jgi:DHA2 family methylenomycin A resistance protein-like MFS transporter
MESARTTLSAGWLRSHSGPASPAVILGLSCLGYFFVLLDVTIVNVALESISSGLSASRSELQWVVDAYALALASLMLSAGHVADGFGRRRVFAFGLATLACALAPGPGALITARVVQGIGAASLLPASLALINASRRDPKERARAIGIWAGLGSLGLVAGPLLGGLLTGAFGWRAVFWFSVPLCATLRWIPESTASEEARRLDPAGQVAGIAFLGGLVGALIEGPNLGWTSPLILALLALGIAGLGALIVVERRSEYPMLDLGYFRNPGFAASNAGAGLMNLGTLGALFVLSLQLQQIQGHSPEATGLLILPLAVPLALLPPFVGRFIQRSGPRLPAALGLAGTGIGFGALALVGSDAAYAAMFAPLLLAGVSLGFATPGVVTGATASVPAERAGMASAVNNTARQCGGAIGVALIGGIAGAGAFWLSAIALLIGGLACGALIREGG